MAKQFMMTRRRFLQASAAGGAAAALAGLPLGRSPAFAAPAFLNYWTGWSGFEFDELQKLVDKFNKANPDIFVNMTTVFGQYDKVLTAIAGGNPPDVVSAVWLRQLGGMAGRGGLTPLTDIATKDGGDGKGYFPQFWNAWQWNNQLWGVMVTCNSQMMAYPAPAGGRENCTTFDGSVFTIPAGVRNKDAAWAFIKWLSEDQQMGDFCFAIHNVPPKVAPANADRFVSDKRFKLALDLLNGKNAFGPDKMPVNDLYDTHLTNA